MNGICVTGSTQKVLDKCSKILMSVGAKMAAATRGADRVTVKKWHESVLLRNSPDQEQLSYPILVGKMWEHQAFEILLTNYDQPVWHWAEEGSALLLNFWKGIDHNLLFLLVYTSPQDFLKELIFQKNYNNKQLDLALRKWVDQTNSLIEFKIKNVDSSIFLSDISIFSDSKSFITLLKSKWDLPLSLEGKFSPPVTHERSLGDLFLENYLHSYPEVLSLHVKALELICAENSLATPYDGLKDKEEFLSFLKDNSAIFNNITLFHNATTKSIEEDFGNAFPNQTLISPNASEADQHLFNTPIDCNSMKSEGSQHTTENDNFIRRLHEVQEALEASLVETEICRAADQEARISLSKAYIVQNSLKSELELAVDENKEITAHLHFVQERLEKNIYLQSELDYYKTRFRRFLVKNPDYWEFEGFELDRNDNGQKKEWTLHFTDVLIGERLIPSLHVRTFLEGNTVGFSIGRDEVKAPKANLTRWPVRHRELMELTIEIKEGKFLDSSQSIVRSFSTSDWLFVGELIKKLIRFLSQSHQPKKSHSENEDKGMVDGLKKVQKALSEYPAIFRFDTVDIKVDKLEGGYSSLEFCLNNVSLLGNNWPEFKFFLSTVHGDGGNFHENPRLEFYQDCQSVLKSWFAESATERGPKLELRFALPKLMDTNVWNSINDEDRLFLSALIANLPDLILESGKTLSNDQINGAGNESWNQWIELSRIVQSILIRNIVGDNAVKN